MHNLIIIGGGGHAKVIADIATKCNYNILGFLDDNDSLDSFLDIKKLGKIRDCINNADKAKFIIAIGNNTVRQRIAQEYNLDYATIIHPSAIVSNYSQIGKGTVIMPLAVINADSKIGEHCIINTSAVVEHDNMLGDFSHISPNSTLCGTVKIGKKCHIGAGATVINNISICDNTTIGAGAVVTKNITVLGIYKGIPAR